MAYLYLQKYLEAQLQIEFCHRVRIYEEYFQAASFQILAADQDKELPHAFFRNRSVAGWIECAMVCRSCCKARHDGALCKESNRCYKVQHPKACNHGSSCFFELG